MPKYFAQIKSQTHGPLSSKELRSLAESGELVPTDLVWQEGSTKKVKAQNVKGLFALSDAPAQSKSPIPKVPDPSRASNIPPTPVAPPDIPQIKADEPASPTRQNFGKSSASRLVSLWSIVGVVLVAAISFVVWYSNAMKVAAVDEANQEILDAVSDADEWLNGDDPDGGIAIENRIIDSLKDELATNIEIGKSKLAEVRLRIKELRASEAFAHAKSLLQKGDVDESILALKAVASMPEAKERSIANDLLKEVEYATSNERAFEHLILIADDRVFEDVKRTGIVDCDAVSDKFVKDIWKDTVRRNLDSAEKKRNEDKIAKIDQAIEQAKQRAEQGRKASIIKIAEIFKSGTQNNTTKVPIGDGKDLLIHFGLVVDPNSKFNMQTDTKGELEAKIDGNLILDSGSNQTTSTKFNVVELKFNATFVETEQKWIVDVPKVNVQELVSKIDLRAKLETAAKAHLAKFNLRPMETAQAGAARAKKAELWKAKANVALLKEINRNPKKYNGQNFYIGCNAWDKTAAVEQLIAIPFPNKWTYDKNEDAWRLKVYQQNSVEWGGFDDNLEFYIHPSITNKAKANVTHRSTSAHAWAGDSTRRDGIYVTLLVTVQSDERRAKLVITGLRHEGNRPTEKPEFSINFNQ